jgi:ubiquinone biosynthesis protein
VNNTLGSDSNEQESLYKPYQEHKRIGLASRFFIAFQHFLGLGLGGGYAYVQEKKLEGEGWSILVLILRVILFFAWPFLDRELVREPFPVQFRVRLERLGPTYMKLGQILSLREDILPKEITSELSQLLERSPAISFERFRELLETDLPRPLGEVFRWIDPIPLGSASLAQTHRARLITHEKVVIKMLKPGVRRMIEMDTRLLRYFGFFLQLLVGRYQPKRLINEFCAYTLREVDLRFEADNAETFEANFKDQPEIRFPKIYRQYSNDNILVMEYFRGLKPGPSLAARMSSAQRKHAVELGIGAVIRMIYQDGFFHADLHPGNLIIFRDAKVGFIDLGMVGRFDRDMRKRMFYYFYSLVTGDTEDAARYLSSLAVVGKKGDLEGFRRAVADLYMRWLRRSNFHEFSLAQVILQSIVLAGQYRIQYPGEIILMVKALVTVEGVGNVIAPGLDIVEASKKHVREILLHEFNPITWLRDSALIVPEMVEVLNRSPLILSEGLRKLESALKQPSNGPVSGVRSTILAGFCVVAGAIVASLGGPWPVWALLFILAIVLAIRK